jgi:hypothetical protein
MSRTFEDRRREKQEKEQRKQVHQERLDAARRAAIEDERRQARDSAQREAARKEQLAEQARLEALAARRAQTRLDLASQLQQQILSVASVVRQKQESRKQGISALRQAQILEREDRAVQAQQRKAARQALAQEQRRIESAGSAAPQPKPSRPKPRRPERPKPDRKQLTKAAAAEEIRQQRKQQAQALQLRAETQDAQRRARKQLLTQQARQATLPSPEPSDKLRREQASAARAAQLAEEQKRAVAKGLRDEQLRTQRKQEAADARKAAERKAAPAEPARKETPQPARPPAKVAERRLARKRALAATAVQPPPEEPLDSFPWLKTKGSFLVDELQNAVYLRGVTCRGFDDISAAGGRTFPEALSLDEPNLSTMTDLWGANIVRIPFQAATVLSGNSSFAADQMLAGLDDVVGAVTTANARVLLSMEAPGGAPDTTAGSDIFRAWSLLANHYQDEAGVLYELFSSPQPLPENWLQTAEMLIGTIRLQNPASLIFVSNGKGGADISGLPIRFSTGDPVFNVVYSIEASDTLVPDPDDAQLRAFAASYPLFASRWSDSNPNADRSSAGTGNLFARYGMGWIAANWNADPRLVRSSIDHDFAPTRWGYVAQRALAQPVKPRLPSVRLEDETASAWRLP